MTTRALARFTEHAEAELAQLQADGLFKNELLLTGAQQTHVAVRDHGDLINLCANNYLGLANHPEIIGAAKEALERYGFGMASVRFICGTQTLHRELEERLSAFLRTDDTILYSSCFDANGGVFEALLGPEDAVISDQLNHASLIDGIRLSKAQRLRYDNNDMDALEARLRESAQNRFRLIVTDGVFSMDGSIARLDQICMLAERHDALVMIDDSHAVGICGPTGRGTHELHNVIGRIDIITGTLGKALGGASGGYVSGRKPLIELLRQRSRPYLFSNSLAPPIAAATLRALDLVEHTPELRDRLWYNTAHFRQTLIDLGFTVLPGTHPITPIMIGDAGVAARLARALQDRGVFLVAFSYPVVPHGQARIRAQVSAAHTPNELDFAVEQLRLARDELDGGA